VLSNGSAVRTTVSAARPVAIDSALANSVPPGATSGHRAGHDALLEAYHATPGARPSTRRRFSADPAGGPESRRVPTEPTCTVP
jgi:hypothetical protein